MDAEIRIHALYRCTVEGDKVDKKEYLRIP